MASIECPDSPVAIHIAWLIVHTLPAIASINVKMNFFINCMRLIGQP